MKKIFLVILILAIVFCDNLQNIELQKSFNNFKAAAKDLIEKFADIWPSYPIGDFTCMNYCQTLGLGEICKPLCDQLEKIYNI